MIAGTEGRSRSGMRVRSGQVAMGARAVTGTPSSQEYLTPLLLDVSCDVDRNILSCIWHAVSGTQGACFREGDACQCRISGH